MRKDTQEELQRLEQELLAEEPEEEMPDYGEFLEEPDSEEPVVYRNASNNYGADLRNYATGYKAYNSDRLDTDLEDFSQRIREEKKPTHIWLPILAVALVAALVAYILWLYLGGAL